MKEFEQRYTPVDMSPIPVPVAEFTPFPIESATDQQAPTPEPLLTVPSTEPAMNTEPTAEIKRRVELMGRAGRDPRMQETAKGIKIAKFPLGEHPEGDEGPTVWHTIVSFKERAQHVVDTVKKGDELKVIGYRSEREYKGKTIEEINAVVVKPTKGASEPTEQAVNERP
jgi:hypothetical protein